jgi:hypothetical protein
VNALLLSAAARAVACDPASLADGLVISEILADPEGVDPGMQWVELYNETGLDLDASGWRIEAGTATYDTASVFPPGTYLIDGEYQVVSQRAEAFASLVLPGFVAGDAAIDADAVRLVDCAGTPVDVVVYGAANTDGWLDATGAVAAALAPAPASGQTLARVGSSFALSQRPTPGSDNALPPVHCGGPGSGLLVNEVFAGDSAWVELLHVGAAPVLLAGWSIAAGTTSFAPVYTFAAGQVASPGARIVVGNIPEAAYDADLSLSGATAVRVVDCKGFASDTLVVGPDNAMGWVDDAGGVAEGLSAPLAPGLSRFPDGADTNDAAVDFAPLPPSPATENAPAPPDTGHPPRDSAEPLDTASPTDTGPAPGGEAPSAPADGCGCRHQVGIPVPIAGLAAVCVVVRRRARGVRETRSR